MPGNAAVIVAAGRGERMGAGGPKQYRDLAGKAVIAHSAAAFLEHPEISWVLVVVHPDDHDLYAAALPAHSRLLPTVNGAPTRQGSVLAGLEALETLQPEKVLIHDAARPFVTAGTISAVIRATAPGVGALPANAVVDTLKRGGRNGEVEATVSRDNLWAAQTPQAFLFPEILAAHRAARAGTLPPFTDDCAVAEHAGMRIAIVPSPPDNMKLTTPHDMETARMRIAPPDIRTGNGYDVHRLIEGDHVWLCGVRIPHDRRLEGHSDADVGLHALTDALLATIADGDIGSHFPPSDPQWKGASSDRFLAHAAGLVRSAGGTINHLDVTLVCEAPKVGPHRDAMRKRMAEIAGIDLSRVSVKATTNEGLGFAGRREGIAAIATATVGFVRS